MPSKISIIIPTYNHCDDLLKPCIDSIVRNTTLDDNIEIIVSANGCTDNTKEYVEGLGKPFKLVLDPKPLGYARAINAGLRVSTGDYVIFLNNDTVILPQPKDAWIKMLVSPFENDPWVGITGPSMLFSEPAGRRFIIFFCACISRAVINKLGLLSEEYGIGGGEDTDYCIQVERLGYKLVQVPGNNRMGDGMVLGDFPIYHAAEKTLHDPNCVKDPKKTFDDNSRRLVEKFRSVKTSVIIPTYNHCEDLLKPCIESLIKYTTLDPSIEIIISANGCTDNTREYVESLGKNFRLVWSDKPTGFTIGTNDGIKVAHGASIVLLSNDTVLLEQTKDDWLKMLTEPLKNPRVGVTGPMLLSWDKEHLDFIVFFCAATRRNLIDEIGLLDEIFNPGFAEDVDFCVKAQKAGYTIVQVPHRSDASYGPNRMVGSFPIFHAGQETLKYLDGVDSLLGRNKLIATKRYPMIPDGWFTATDIHAYRDFLKNKVPVGGVIAELGCFKGRSLASVSDIIKDRKLKVVVVDTFKGTPGESLDFASPEIFKKEDIKSIFLSNMESFGLTPQVLSMTTHEASTLFEDNYFDMVFIDADHSYNAVRQDIQDWWPKVKRGGLLSGHDFRWQPIRDALTVEFGNSVLSNWDNIWFVPRPKVYDCFPFFNELDQLEIRLNELDKEVDYFVLVEGTETQQAKPKPLYFNENKKRFEKFLHKIIHVVVDDWPKYIPGVYDSSWTRERFQRDSIMRGLKDIGEYDIIILGDADEIMSASALRGYKCHLGLCKLEMNFYFYYINYLARGCMKPGGKWMESRIVPVSYFRKYSMTPCSVRYSPGSLQYHHIDRLPSLPNAGWHFSFQGGIDAIMEKIKSYAHQEFNRPDILDRARIEKLVAEGKDVFGREDQTYVIVPVDETYPKYVLDNIDKFRHMIRE